METKDLIALFLIPAGLLAGTIILTYSHRLRDVAFFFMVAAFVISDKLDVNFLSRQWYRGTTRGIEISYAVFCLKKKMVSMILAPRLGQKRFYWPARVGLMLLYLG